jgi:hypothetical protein
VSTRKIYIRSHPSCQGNHPSGCCSHSAKIAMDTSLLEAPAKRPPISPILLCSANRSTTECRQVAGAAQSQAKKGAPLGTPLFRNCLGLPSLLHRPGGFSRFTGIFSTVGSMTLRLADGGALGQYPGHQLGHHQQRRVCVRCDRLWLVTSILRLLLPTRRPRHSFCWENLFVDGQNPDEERPPT